MNIYILKLPPDITKWLNSQFSEQWRQPGFTLPEKYRYLVISCDMLQLCTTSKAEALQLAKKLLNGKVYDRRENRYLFIG